MCDVHEYVLLVLYCTRIFIRQVLMWVFADVSTERELTRCIASLLNENILTGLFLSKVDRRLDYLKHLLVNMTECILYQIRVL